MLQVVSSSIEGSGAAKAAKMPMHRQKRTTDRNAMPGTIRWIKKPMPLLKNAQGIPRTQSDPVRLPCFQPTATGHMVLSWACMWPHMLLENGWTQTLGTWLDGPFEDPAVSNCRSNRFKKKTKKQEFNRGHSYSFCRSLPWFSKINVHIHSEINSYKFNTNQPCRNPRQHVTPRHCQPRIIRLGPHFLMVRNSVRPSPCWRCPEVTRWKKMKKKEKEGPPLPVQYHLNPNVCFEPMPRLSEILVPKAVVMAGLAICSFPLASSNWDVE